MRHVRYIVGGCSGHKRYRITYLPAADIVFIVRQLRDAHTPFQNYLYDELGQFKKCSNLLPDLTREPLTRITNSRILLQIAGACCPMMSCQKPHRRYLFCRRHDVIGHPERSKEPFPFLLLSTCPWVLFAYVSRASPPFIDHTQTQTTQI